MTAETELSVQTYTHGIDLDGQTDVEVEIVT